MIVVSDTSPIFQPFCKLARLDLLRRIFSQNYYSCRSLCGICRIEGHKEFLLKQDWIETATLSDTNLKNRLLKDLDDGEAEAIALAVELKADYLLMDETKGRQVAEKFRYQSYGYF